jgi:DNA-binding transcriptional LysR family regulator
MDLRHARTFVTVADLGTVSKAALRLHTAQPALSRQISDMERDLGLKLFERVGRRLRLTGEGEQILGDCRVLLDCAAGIQERAQLLRHGDTGVLKVAASPQFMESCVSNVLLHYAQRYPGVQVKLFEAVGAENLAMLERGEIHLGQNLSHAVAPDDHRFGSHPVGSLELLAAFQARRFGDIQAIEIEDLATHPLLVLESGFSVRRTFDAACRLAGVKPNVSFESHAPHTLLALASAGHGVAVIPSSLRTEPHDLQIVRVTYRRQPVRESVVMFWDKRRSLPSYAIPFCEMCAAHIRRYQAFPIKRPSGSPSRGAVGQARVRR